MNYGILVPIFFGIGFIIAYLNGRYHITRFQKALKEYKEGAK